MKFHLQYIPNASRMAEEADMPFACQFIILCDIDFIPLNSMAGISRSATLVIAYVMSQVYRTEPMSLLRSFFHTQKRRCGICPNEGFFRQLILYEKLLNDTEYSQSPIFNLFPCTQSSMVPTSHDEPK
eukprot:TRINITY_DN6492_c0_g1_i1.p1 TRINITY_DN6492_c0_g1~~TRINITY_DN6492_c0_g1_i1.p1  ORF type:complete len:128 (+),score=17.72 TRINITY_DN6492_c0_g1_i1:96-479(+)